MVVPAVMALEGWGVAVVADEQRLLVLLPSGGRGADLPVRVLVQVGHEDAAGERLIAVVDGLQRGALARRQLVQVRRGDPVVDAGDGADDHVIYVLGHVLTAHVALSRRQLAQLPDAPLDGIARHLHPVPRAVGDFHGALTSEDQCV